MADADFVRVPDYAVVTLIADAFVAAGLPSADATRCAD